MDLLLLAAYVAIIGAFFLVIIQRLSQEKLLIFWTTLSNLVLIFFAVVISFQEWLIIGVGCLALLILIIVNKILLGKENHAVKFGYFIVIGSIVVAKALESPEIVIIVNSIPLLIYPVTQFFVTKKFESKPIPSTERSFLIFFWTIAALSCLVNCLVLVFYGIALEYSVYYASLLSFMVIFLFLYYKISKKIIDIYLKNFSYKLQKNYKFLFLVEYLLKHQI